MPDVANITPNTATLSWFRPHHDGGSPITGYVIDKKDRYSTRWTKLDEVPASQTEYNIRGLQEGNEYEFRVSTVNKAGVGKPSTPCERFTAKAQYGEFFFMKMKTSNKHLHLSMKVEMSG